MVIKFPSNPFPRIDPKKFTKFKKDGLKNGQITTLDKNAAQVLGKEKNREIKFTGFQQFLKEIYDEDKNISNTKE